MKYNQKNRRIHIGIWLFCALFSMVGILLFCGHTEKKASAADYDKLKQQIITAYQKYETSVNVKAYKLYNDTATSSKISSMFEEIMNETPYLFYNGRSFSKAIEADSNQILTIGLEYSNLYKKNGKVDVSKIEKVKKKIHAAILSGNRYVKKNMTDVEKAMVLHDYLIRKVNYSNDGVETECLTEAGALLKNKANCQGYALAYKMLLKKAGIESICLSSEDMDHMWNLVRINGKWYHVDLVWDDPVYPSDQSDRDGVVLHQHFLLSDRAIKKTGHTGFVTGKATDKRYDKKYWRKCATTFWYQNNGFLYGTSRGIYTRKTLGSKTKQIKKANVSCLIRSKADTYYFIKDKKSIWLYQGKKNQYKKILTSKYPIEQLKYSGNRLKYKINKNDNLYIKYKRG